MTTPRIPDDVVRERFGRGLTDTEIADGYAGANADYARLRRMVLGLKRRTGRNAGTIIPKVARESRRGSHALAGRPAQLPPVDNPALTEKRTIYPATVVDVAGLNNVLISGINSKKIGGMITKGPAKGFPIYTLTLEERATCPTSCGHWRSCVVPGTRVLTADLRWQAIETLSIGQRIVGFDENPTEDQRRRTRIAVVEKLGLTSLLCFEIVTDRGTITASGDHQWIARPGKRRTASDPNFRYRWRTTSELGVGHTIQFLAEPWEQDTSYEAGRLRGFIEGEGHASTWGNNGFAKTRVGWSQRTGRLIDEINEIARSKGYPIKERKVVSGLNDCDMTLTELQGGWREAAKFLGTIRPSRLMDRSEEVVADHDLGQGTTPAKILSIRAVGARTVVEIQTSTRTMVTEGFMSHNCYGNSMNWAKRIKHGPEFESRLAAELTILQSRHPRGFAVRLHVLGDFYSVEYVRLWESFLTRFRSMFVFGFSARWRREDPIAVALVDLVVREWGRFSIRFSDAPVDECATVSIEHPLQKPDDAIVCPAQVGKTESCGTCGLCWHTRRRIAFLQHAIVAMIGGWAWLASTVI